MTQVEFVNAPSVELISTNADDNMVAMAAWVSNGQDSQERLEDQRRVKGLINFLLRNKHMSPFEHGQYIFKVDVPIFVAREFHRHRTMSYNEISGRYTEMKPRFYVPPFDRPLVQEGSIGSYTFVPGSDEQYALVKRSIEIQCQTAYDAYERMMGAGIAKEVARQVLPLNLMTQFYATVNPRNLMQFLDLRTEAQAMAEIRAVANDIEKIFADHQPLTHQAWSRARTLDAEVAAKLEVNTEAPAKAQALRTPDSGSSVVIDVGPITDLNKTISRLRERWGT